MLRKKNLPGFCTDEEGLNEYYRRTAKARFRVSTIAGVVGGIILFGILFAMLVLGVNPVTAVAIIGILLVVEGWIVSIILHNTTVGVVQQLINEGIAKPLEQCCEKQKAQSE